MKIWGSIDPRLTMLLSVITIAPHVKRKTRSIPEKNNEMPPGPDGDSPQGPGLGACVEAPRSETVSVCFGKSKHRALHIGVTRGKVNALPRGWPAANGQARRIIGPTSLGGGKKTACDLLAARLYIAPTHRQER